VEADRGQEKEDGGHEEGLSEGLCERRGGSDRGFRVSGFGFRVSGLGLL
jgi:hypothetical protein